MNTILTIVAKPEKLHLRFRLFFKQRIWLEASTRLSSEQLMFWYWLPA